MRAYQKNKQRKQNLLGPNLTRTRGKLLYEASQTIKDKKLSGVQFVFANIHGDLHVRLTNPCNDSEVHPFETLQDLDTFLMDNGIINESCFC